MNKLLFTAIAFSLTLIINAQVGINTDSPKTTIDVVGKPTETTSLDGIIAPRITGNQLKAKSYTSTEKGAFVYVTDAATPDAGSTTLPTYAANLTSEGYYFWDGNKWVKLASGNFWGTEGNSGTNSTSNFLGTTDNQALNLRTNNTDKVTILPNGSVGIGTTTPTAKLNLKGGKMLIESWYNTGHVAYKETVGRLLLAGETNSPGGLGGATPGDALISIGGKDYKANVGEDYYKGAIVMITNPGAENPTLPNNLAIFNKYGNFGIGNINPTEKLEVNGKIKASNIIFTGIPGYNSNIEANNDNSLPAGSLYKLNSSNQIFIK